MNFSICLIAKNEEKTLPRLMGSLKEFQQRGGEVLLLDTGSTDGTAKLAESLGCRVIAVGDKFITTIDKDLADKINHRFVEDGEETIVTTGDRLFDYSAARNYIADFATTDMVATPDCDEIYTKFDIDKIEQAIRDGAEQLEYQFVFSHDEFGKPVIQFLHSKFYNRKKAKWVGIVHEVLSGEVKRQYLDESIIKLEHWQNPSAHRGRYLPGLALDCYLNQKNDRNSHYLARELLWAGRYRSAIKEFKRHLTISHWLPERSQSMIFIGDAFRKLGDDAEARQWWHRAYLENPDRREPLIRLAEYVYEKGDPDRTKAYCEAALTIPWSGFYANFADHYRHVPHDMLAWAYWVTGDRKKSQENWEAAHRYQPQNRKFCSSVELYLPRLPKVSIVIPTLGRKEKLDRLLSLISQEACYKNYEVIVKQDSFENRKGVPRLVAEGVSESNGELIMYLGNDCVPRTGFLSNAVWQMYKSFGDLMDGLVGLNDEYWHGEWATHWLASKKLLPQLEGEFFSTEYLHTGCDNELTERCRNVGKYAWAENARVYHDHPLQNNFSESTMDEVYKLAYDPKSLEVDKATLERRSKKYGFEIKLPYLYPKLRSYPSIHPSIDLRPRLADLPIEDLHVLNVSIGSGESGLASQLPFFRFRELTHVEIHQPYIDKAKQVIWDAYKVYYINCDITDIDDLVYRDCDVVFFFDVLEHLTKDDALTVLRRAMQTRKRIIVFGPLEPKLMNHRHEVDDIESQKHLSLWTEQDFKGLGFTTEILLDFHHEEGKSFPAVWATLNLKN